MSRFLILRGTRPQSRKLCLRAGLRSAVLVDGEPVTVFADRRQARRAINRTAAAVEALGARSLHRDWLKDRPEFASLFSPEPFTIVPVEFLTSTGAVVSEVAAIAPDSRDEIRNLASRAVTLNATVPVSFTEFGRNAQRPLFDPPLTLQPGESIELPAGSTGRAPNGIGNGPGPGGELP